MAQQDAWYDGRQSGGQGFGPGAGQGMGRGIGPGGGARGAFAPGARIAGALICVVLVGVEIAWLVRDVGEAGFHDTLWAWLGLQLPLQEHGLLGTGGLDGVLLVLLLGALAASPRAGAGWAYAAVGLFAVAYRVPGLWIYTADWAKDAPVHDRALGTCVGFVVAGVALVVIGLAGRRPAGLTGPAGPEPYGAADAVTGPGAPPAPPRTGAGVAGGLLAIALAMELAGWQIYYVQEYAGSDSGYPPHLYKHLLTGERTISSMLDTPPSYGAWITVVLALVTAVAAFVKAPLARPLGMALGFMMFLNGVIGLDTWHTEKLLFKTDLLPTSAIAAQSFLIFELVAGLLLVILFSLRGGRRPALPPSAWGPPGAPNYGPSPGGWGGYGYPQTYPQQQPPAAGGFGPPPNLPPNLPPRPGQLPPPPSNYPSYPSDYPPNVPPPPDGPPRS